MDAAAAVRTSMKINSNHMFAGFGFCNESVKNMTKEDFSPETLLGLTDVEE